MVGSEPPTAKAGHGDSTRAPRRWSLDDQERLVLTVTGERYLRHEAHPQPASWTNTAGTLRELQPHSGWTAKRAEHIVATVRRRMVDAGVRGLRRDEVGEPVGNSVNHNLMLELLVSTTLVPSDLRLLD